MTATPPVPPASSIPPPRGAADSAGTPAPDDLTRRLGLALVCAAADPALGGVLLLDLDPRLVEPVVRLFGGILAGAAEPARPPLVLGAADRDEDLWTRTRISGGEHGITVRTEPGPLVEADDAPGAPPLVVVPDLMRLSVAGMRAAVQLLGAEVATVERSGLRGTVRPRARWLATCRAADAGRLSRHLLDRFAVRLSVAELRLPGPAGPLETLHAGLPAVWRTAASGVRPVPVTDAALTRAQELLGPDAGVRRQLALVRLARTLAALEGRPSASAGHSEDGARLIGVAVPDPARRRPQDATEPPDPAPGPAGPPGTLPERRGAGRPDPHRVRDDRALLDTGPAEGVGTGPGPVPAPPGSSPYPEDGTAGARDAMPLSGPRRRTTGPVSARGAVIGTRRATDLRDIAHVRTVREAAVHQRARRTERFTVSPADLHSNVRAAAPERVLVLLLDHTCREPDGNWQETLAPFLQWAYTGRATVQVIEVGAADAADELRAGSFAARSVLDPRVPGALYRGGGRATPLAHGVELAAHTLRRLFRRQGTGPAEAWLVVVTDGRGNVPLRVSHTGRPAGEVAAAGIEDAVEAAARIGAMDRTRLHVAVVDPGREPYGDLPHVLADRLGAVVVDGRHRTGGEGTGD
ncbi:magnesium chelatase [Streptomyces sp. enrichment culture]|uniref:magnesium chelatase n=1 Tax=Streptomyces sp. enrichment culture TaxID=1795815 RepID=UPI003F575193